MLATALSLAAAVAGGLLAGRVQLPGGMIVGALTASAAVSLAFDGVEIPETVRSGLFVGVGMTIGMGVTRDMLASLRHFLIPSLLSAVLLILAGGGSALLLRWLGVAPAGDLLATSPGALSVLSAAAIEHEAGAPTVALFHVTRIVLILLALPFLTRLLPDPVAPEAPARRPANRGNPGLPGLTSLGIGAAGAGLGVALATLAGLPGVLIFGASMGAAAASLAIPRSLSIPRWFRLAIPIGIGWVIGGLFTSDTLAVLQSALLPGILAATILIGAGIAVAYLLRALGHAPPGDVLATSPGALESLSMAAVERGEGALHVAMFHTVRVLLVILSLPLLLALMQR